jgi:predicted dithiol-disulfide oxidoreductase (DUF899 family)
MSAQRITELEKQIYELNTELQALHKSHRGEAVPEYSFATMDGSATLRDLFAGRDTLLAIHNMGQACRYCTLWADGFNPFVPHLESVLSVVLLSKDPPHVQRQFANARQWRFRMASHGGGEYIEQQGVTQDGGNNPGAVVYVREGDTIYRKNACEFGPGDLYCSMWSLLGLAGLGVEDWTPQYGYWSRPATLEDGGENIRDANC